MMTVYGIVEDFENHGRLQNAAGGRPCLRKFR